MIDVNCWDFRWSIMFIVHLFCVLFLHFRLDIQHLPTRMTGVDTGQTSQITCLFSFSESSGYHIWWFQQTNERRQDGFKLWRRTVCKKNDLPLGAFPLLTWSWLLIIFHKTGFRSFLADKRKTDMFDSGWFCTSTKKMIEGFAYFCLTSKWCCPNSWVLKMDYSYFWHSNPVTEGRL